MKMPFGGLNGHLSERARSPVTVMKRTIKRNDETNHGRVGPLSKMKTSRFHPLYFQWPLSGPDWALLSLGWAQWRSQGYGDWVKLAMEGPLVEWKPSQKMKTSRFFAYFTFEVSMSGLGWALLILSWATKA